MAEESIGRSALPGYAKVKTGMPYRDVARLMGSEGRLATTSSLNGTKLEAYLWQDRPAGAYYVVFAQDRVVTKRRFDSRKD